MKTHPMKQANDDAARSVRFYELLGLRAVLVEEVVRCARLYFGDMRVSRQPENSLSVAVTRLDAVEKELRELSPNLTFDRSGEPCLNPS